MRQLLPGLITLTMTSGLRCPGRTPRATFTDIRVLDGNRPGLAAALESATQNYWDPRSRGPLVPTEDAGIAGCGQQLTNESACADQPSHRGYLAILW